MKILIAMLSFLTFSCRADVRNSHIEEYCQIRIDQISWEMTHNYKMTESEKANNIGMMTAYYEILNLCYFD